MKIHSCRLRFCSVSKSLCDLLTQVSYHLDFSFPEGWTREGFLLAKDAVTLLALWRCGFIDESIGDYSKVLFILSCGLLEENVTKDEEVIFLAINLIFEKTK